MYIRNFHLNSILYVALFSALLVFTPQHAVFGATVSIPSTVSSVDCTSFSGGIRPGDTLTLTSGTRGPLTIRNCTGSASSPIQIKNSSTGPTTIQRTSGGDGSFVFVCDSCTHVVIDGTVKWSGAPATSYGIKVTMTGGGSPSAFVKIGGTSRFLTIRGVEVDGKWPSLADNGIGISVNDHMVIGSENPGLWREGIVIEQCYVHDIEGEGMYVGPNWYQDNLRLRNTTIRNNLVERTGWDGINMKSTIQGTNDIHHNVIRNVGLDTVHVDEAGQRQGIAIFEGAGRIFNNWVENTGEHGIQQYLMNLPSSYGTQNVEIFNNVVINTGITGPQDGKGITSGSKDDPATANTFATIYNNTVIDTEAQGIIANTRVVGGFIRDNIVVGAGSSAVSAPSSVTISNNRTGTMSSLGFVDASGRNFRLSSGSPARNTAVGPYPSTDLAGITRPRDGGADQGAYEGSTGDLYPSGTGTTPPPVTPSTCTNQQTSTASIPTGYGASYNPLTSAREYLVQASCTNTTNATITAGNGNPLTYVYNRGYYYSGTAWTPYTLTCASGALISGAWCPGRATASIPLPQNPTNVIAYTCQYTNSTWKCGCRDATCSTAYWQLQRIQR